MDKTHCIHGHVLTEGNLLQGRTRASGRLVCKICHNKATRETKKRRRAGTQALSAEKRTQCPQGHAYTGDNLVRTPKSSRRCRACHNASEKKRRHANLEANRVKQRTYTQTDIQKAKTKVRQKEWRDKNRLYVNTQARRALQVRRLSSQAEEYAKILKGDVCSFCGTRERLTIDHIDAVSRGGLNEWTNLTIACHSCNSSKWDRPLIIWIASNQVALRSGRWVAT